MRGPGGALLIALLALRTAGAQPDDCVPVAVESCDPWVAASEFARALAAEGVRCGHVVSCRGGRLRVDGEDTGQPLDPIPSGVRARVLALLVAERLRQRTLLAAAPDTTAPTPASRSDTPPRSTLAAELDAPTGAGEGAAGSPRRGRPREADLAPLRRARPRGLVERANDRLARRSSPRIGLAAEARLFLSPLTPVVGPVLQLDLHAFRAEIAWDLASAGGPLGSVDLGLGRLAAGVAPLCLGSEDAGICAAAFLEVAYARARSRATEAAFGDRADAPYGGAFLEVHGFLASRWVAGALAVRGGWGYGLVFTDGDRELAALGGGWLAASLSLAVGPFS